MLPASVKNLIAHFSRLPGIGPKTAERLVFYLLKTDKNNLKNFGETLLHIQDNIKKCEQCGQISENKLCSICANKNRDATVICVVAEASETSALEKSGEFQGVYHVLDGLLNPTEGITADKLNINQLETRLKNNNIQEVILALNPTIEGETTNLFLTKILKKYKVKITKLARGLPQGSDLEYADEITLANAFKGRVNV